MAFSARQWHEEGGLYPRYDRRGTIERDIGASTPVGRGGKPENVSTPPAPPASTGTRYPVFVHPFFTGQVDAPLSPERSQEEGRALRQSQLEEDALRSVQAAGIELTSPEEGQRLREESMARSRPEPSGIGVPGTLNYSIGGGPMRSRAAGQGGPAGEDFSATQGSGFGQTWKPGGGGFIQSDIDSLPWDQKPESYRASHQSPAEEMVSPVGVERERSRLQEDVEKRRRKDYEASVNHAQDVAQQFIQEAQAKPEPERTAAVAKVTADLEDRIKTITQSFGIGARLTSNELYR